MDTGFLLVDILLRKDSPSSSQKKKNYSSQQTLRGDRAVPLVPISDSQIWRRTGLWTRSSTVTLNRGGRMR